VTSDDLIINKNKNKNELQRFSGFLLCLISMYRKVSRDLKLCAIKMYELNILPLHLILECVGFSESTFYRILDLWVTTGDVVVHNFGTLPGRPRLLHFDNVNYLLRLVQLRPDWFLDELLGLLKTNRFISVHYVTIHRELCRARVSLKKLKKIASERNEDVRNDYIERMAQYEPDELGFIDEISKNDKTPARSRGHSKKGHRAVMKQKFICGRRLIATALLTSKGITASRVIEGSMTKVLYLDFLENDVVCGITFFYE